MTDKHSLFHLITRCSVTTSAVVKKQKHSVRAVCICTIGRIGTLYSPKTVNKLPLLFQSCELPWWKKSVGTARKRASLPNTKQTGNAGSIFAWRGRLDLNCLVRSLTKPFALVGGGQKQLQKLLSTNFSVDFRYKTISHLLESDHESVKSQKQVQAVKGRTEENASRKFEEVTTTTTPRPPSL